MATSLPANLIRVKLQAARAGCRSSFRVKLLSLIQADDHMDGYER
ncbi:hypothetical protein AB9P05_21015 [Roseivirga sp. BDSF3-8]